MSDCGSGGYKFRLSVRCSGCKKVSTHILVVPAVEDAPSDVDELLASAFLQRQRFECPPCESWIGKIIGASQVWDEAA